MRTQELVADIGTGVVGGYVGTKVLEQVSMKLYELESEGGRQREDEVRPGSPPEIAARRTTQLLGLQLSDKSIGFLATYLFHYGLGMSWGAVYTLLRRRTRWNAAATGLGTGAAMSLIVDEGMTPALGFSAPNRDYPLVTHLRGFVAHLVFGLGVAATAETIYWLGRNGGKTG